MHTVIPNFVDIDRFRPATDAQCRAARARFNLSDTAFVIGEVAAVKTHHKRIDWLIRAFAGYADKRRDAGRPVILAIAGARTPETEAIRALADSVAPGRVFFFMDLSASDMPVFYQALDLFAHAALFEMMPIALLEALASGLPVIHHQHPVMSWMTGEGGVGGDLRRETALGDMLAGLVDAPTERQRLAICARVQAETRFSKQIVIPQILDYYREVVGARNDD